MATQADILTSIRDRLNESTARAWTDVQLRKWINEGVRDIARQCEIVKSDATVSTSASTQQYTMTENIVRIYRVEWSPSSGSNVYPLLHRDMNSMDQIWWNQKTQSEGTPNYWTDWGYPPSLKVSLYPTPSEAGTLTVYYYAVPADLATDGTAAASTITLPTGWEDLVVDYAEYHALRKDADPRWQEAKGLYDERLGNMYDLTRRYSDQGDVFGSSDQTGLPGWLVNHEWV